MRREYESATTAFWRSFRDPGLSPVGFVFGYSIAIATIGVLLGAVAGLIIVTPALATILAFMVAGHFVADYPLQGDFLSKAKADGPLRIWHLFGHSAIHGGMILLITGSLLLAIFETVAHFVIDELKVKQVTTFGQDQALHMLCKTTWLLLLAWGIA